MLSKVSNVVAIDEKGGLVVQDVDECREFYDEDYGGGYDWYYPGAEEVFADDIGALQERLKNISRFIFVFEDGEFMDYTKHELLSCMPKALDNDVEWRKWLDKMPKLKDIARAVREYEDDYRRRHLS